MCVANHTIQIEDDLLVKIRLNNLKLGCNIKCCNTNNYQLDETIPE